MERQAYEGLRQAGGQLGSQGAGLGGGGPRRRAALGWKQVSGHTQAKAWGKTGQGGEAGMEPGAGSVCVVHSHRGRGHGAWGRSVPLLSR